MHVHANRCASPTQFSKTSGPRTLSFLPARLSKARLRPWLASTTTNHCSGQAWSCHVEPFSDLRSKVPPVFDWPPTKHKLPPGHCLERLSGSVVPEPLLCQFTAATSWPICTSGVALKPAKKKKNAVQPSLQSVCRGQEIPPQPFPSISCPCSLLKCIFPAPRAALQKTGSLPVPMAAPSRHLDA